MAWIESHQSLKDHPKTRKLARVLDTSIPAAIGHLQCLWWWCLDYAEDGDLSRHDVLDIALGGEWEDDPHQFVDALVNVGFLDEDADGLRVHDWSDYAGKLIDRRKANAERMRRARAERETDTFDTSAPHEPSTSQPRATHVQRTQRARVELPTKPTVPNQPNQQDRTEPRDPRARETPADPPERAIPISQPDPSGFEKRFAKPDPFLLVAAMCDELGVWADDLSKRDRGRQTVVAKRLTEEGMTPEDIRRIARWLKAQDWVTSVDMALIEKQRGRWVLAGKPDHVAPAKTVPKPTGKITSIAELMAYGADDEHTADQAPPGDSGPGVAEGRAGPRDDPGISAGAPGRGSRAARAGSG